MSVSQKNPFSHYSQAKRAGITDVLDSLVGGIVESHKEDKAGSEKPVKAKAQKKID